ncbi:hypothetical protein NDU88_004419 [Pleurodeles waltl]|uniref:Uncharacterized protein n=1 Tax=Pleurodeles waltl TaxID=8319 RepID=A0AAV7MTV4_PLEWA|nr:hypothetical protein NDU88_004419 [Pleurodeles waltl]
MEKWADMENWSRSAERSRGDVNQNPRQNGEMREGKKKMKTRPQRDVTTPQLRQQSMKEQGRSCKRREHSYQLQIRQCDRRSRDCSWEHRSRLRRESAEGPQKAGVLEPKGPNWACEQRRASEACAASFPDFLFLKKMERQELQRICKPGSAGESIPQSLLLQGHTVDSVCDLLTTSQFLLPETFHYITDGVFPLCRFADRGAHSAFVVRRESSLPLARASALGVWGIRGIYLSCTGAPWIQSHRATASVAA